MAAKSSDVLIYNYKLKHDSEVIKKQNDQRRDRMPAREVMVIEDKWVTRELMWSVL